jgi:hypothetical protein
MSVDETRSYESSTKINCLIREFGMHSRSCVVTDPSDNAVIDKQCGREGVAG